MSENQECNEEDEKDEEDPEYTFLDQMNWTTKDAHQYSCLRPEGQNLVKDVEKVSTNYPLFFRPYTFGVFKNTESICVFFFLLSYLLTIH